MPKSAKEKKAAKSTKDKPYSRAARSDPTSRRLMSTLTKLFRRLRFKSGREADNSAPCRYYNDNQNHGGSSNKADTTVRAQLNKFFDDLIPEEEKARSSEPISEIGAEQSMAYLERLEVNMANYELFVVLEIVKAESIGTITRSGFVDGWARVIAETSSHANSSMRVTPDWDGQQQYVRGRVAQAMADDDYFKTLYDFAFQVGREPPQKAVGMAVAVSFWEGLYEPHSNPWRSAHVNWLEQWTAYLREKYGVVKTNEDGEEEVEYKRTVSKDLWTQTRLFAIKTMKDETLGFWSEEQAWPGIIDDFVLWCREKGVVKETEPVDVMEAD
ncbi:Cullin binding-domain-containing protein [Chaetomium tenue]|uniref:Cullin binding-domain-containing protein n=1 Tax=Chaetomium tenue TaxID=1854479 RepID=A0ACB7P0A6_9PEZI|nr:Cullin binding-domain-containing protein [Chaetomium globosum]